MNRLIKSSQVVAVATAVFLLLCSAGAATDKKSAAHSEANLTDEQQFRVMRAFGVAFPDLQKFALNFPATPFLVSRTSGTQASMNGTLQLSQYAVIVSVSGTFDSDFKTLKSAHFDMFAGHDLAIAMRVNEARAPQKFDPADLGRFCDDPIAYLKAKFTRPTSK